MLIKISTVNRAIVVSTDALLCSRCLPKRSVSYILINDINIFLLSGLLQTDQREHVWHLSCQKMASRPIHPGTNSSLTCDGPVPVMLQETSVLSVIDFGNGEGRFMGWSSSSPSSSLPTAPVAPSYPQWEVNPLLWDEPAKTIKKKRLRVKNIERMNV